MINWAINWVQYVVFAVGAFLLAVILSVVIPEAIRKRWPVALGLLAAGAVIAVERVSEEQS